MTRVFAVHLLVLVAMLAGCMPSLWVHERVPDPTNDGPDRTGTKDVKGIPFYTKIAYFEQVTAYEKRWKLVTLRSKTRLLYRKEGVYGALDTEHPAVAIRTAAGTPELKALKDAALDGDVRRIRLAFKDLKALDIDAIKEATFRNDVERKVQVSYDRELYLNAPLPWFGTSKTTTKLAADGTLTEASTEAETKLAEGLSTLFPIKEALSAAASKAFDSGSFALLNQDDLNQASIKEGDAEKTFELIDLEIKDEGLIWEFHRSFPTSPVKEDGTLEEIPFKPASFPHTVRPITVTAAAKTPDKDADRKIAVSGSVLLPETKGKK